MFTPEALPSSSRRTLDSTRLATGAKYSDMPTPAITNDGTRSAYGTVGDEIAAIQPRALAMRAMPAISSGRLPMRSERMPAMGATSMGIAVQGSVRRPACSGV